MRRWPRRLLIAVNIVVALCLLGVASAYGYVRWRLDSIHTVAAPHLTPVTTPASHSGGSSKGSSKGSSGGGSGLAPENILLIGNQTRAGLTNPTQIAQLGSPQVYSGSLSDVIMVLHLDPAKRTASILSIPRDLFLPMPAGSQVGGYQKIDAALNDGSAGPDNLIQAITDDLGIPINHFMELNFNGFERTVNAIGGINVDFPEPVFDRYSLLNIATPGCIHLNGTEALALVRARHLQYDPPGVPASPKSAWPYDPESDLARIVRDHTFLRILASTAESKGLTNPIRANAFIGAIINQITIDPGLKGQLLSLVARYRHLNAGSVSETTLPVTQVGPPNGYVYGGVNKGDVEFPDQPADDAAIAAWDGSALPTPAPPSSVQVYNITGKYHLAADTAAGLVADGINATAAGNGTDPASTSETLIRYHSGSLPQAIDVMDHLSGAVTLQASTSVSPGAVVLDAGSTLAVKGAAPTGSSASGSSASGSAASGTSASSGSTAAPTPGGQAASSAADKIQPWDPRPCPKG